MTLSATVVSGCVDPAGSILSSIVEGVMNLTTWIITGFTAQTTKGATGLGTTGGRAAKEKESDS